MQEFQPWNNEGWLPWPCTSAFQGADEKRQHNLRVPANLEYSNRKFALTHNRNSVLTCLRSLPICPALVSLHFLSAILVLLKRYILTAVDTKIVGFWNVTPCIRQQSLTTSEEPAACPEDGSSGHLTTALYGVTSQNSVHNAHDLATPYHNYALSYDSVLSYPIEYVVRYIIFYTESIVK